MAEIFSRRNQRASFGKGGRTNGGGDKKGGRKDLLQEFSVEQESCAKRRNKFTFFGKVNFMEGHMCFV